MPEPSSTFYERDSESFRAFRAGNYNPRTRLAWEHGVRVAALGQDSVYHRSRSSDYAVAESGGRAYGDRRLHEGAVYRCPHCHALANREPADPAEVPHA